MGLEHVFYLITQDEYEVDCLQFESSSNHVSIHDDIVQYIQDTLNWVPSINPAMNYEKGFGLNNYGITLFDKEGAKVILRLAKAWADLFSSAPASFQLTGNYCLTGNGTYMKEGQYEVIEVSREELVESFRRLQVFSEKVISNGYFILHHGI